MASLVVGESLTVADCMNHNVGNPHVGGEGKASRLSSPPAVGALIGAGGPGRQNHQLIQQQQQPGPLVMIVYLLTVNFRLNISEILPPRSPEVIMCWGKKSTRPHSFS